LAATNQTVVKRRLCKRSIVGVTAISASGHPAAALMLRNVVVSGNKNTGLDAEPNAILRIAHSVVTGNGSVVATNGGTVFSYRDNDIDGNTNNNTGVLNPLAKH
jgi:hypothetical protein